MKHSKIQPWKKVLFFGIAITVSHVAIIGVFSSHLIGYFQTLNLADPWVSMLSVPGRGGAVPFAFITPFILSTQLLFLGFFSLVPFIQIFAPICVVPLLILVGILRRTSRTFIRDGTVVFFLFTGVDLALTNFSSNYYSSIIAQKSEEQARMAFTSQKDSELELRPDLNDLDYLALQWDIYKKSRGDAPDLFYFNSPGNLRTVVVEPMSYKNPQLLTSDVCGDFFYLQLAIFDKKSGRCMSNMGYGDPGYTLGIFWNKKNGDYKELIEKLLKWNDTETELSLQKEIPLQTPKGPVICHALGDDFNVTAHLKIDGIKRENFYECFNLKFR